MLYIYDGLNYVMRAVHLGTLSLRDVYTMQKGQLVPSVWVWEGKGGNQLRREKYPDYKMNRDSSKKEEIFRYVKLLQDVLALTNTVQITVDGYEGDDVIYNLVRMYSDKTDKIFIDSTDRDFRQLQRPKDNLLGLCEVDGFTTVDPTSPDEFIRVYKTLVGDKSDNIKGIPGCGNVAFSRLDAEAILNIFESGLWENLPHFLTELTDKSYAWACANLDTIKIMYEITGFYHISDEVMLANIRVGQSNPELAEAILKQYLQ